MIARGFFDTEEIDLLRRAAKGDRLRGAGFIMADCHLLAYAAAGIHPVAIASRRPETAATVAARHGIRRVHDSLHDSLERPHESGGEDAAGAVDAESVHQYTLVSGRLPTMQDHPTTAYFQHVRRRPDRVIIHYDWILQVIDAPEREEIQPDGRIRRWKRIAEAGGRALRVILLADKLTIHNAFFDRDYQEQGHEGQIF